MILTTSLGDSREVTRFYPDESFDCPYCFYAVITPKTQCENPWCDTTLPVHILTAERAKRAAKQAEEEQRKRNNEWAFKRAQQEHEAHNAWQSAQIAEARKRGACTHCLFQAGWERVKFIKHRGECPKLRK